MTMIMDFLDFLVNGPREGSVYTVDHPDDADREDEVDVNESPTQRTKRPICTSCGDPNFSLEKPRCIACRIALPSS
jgi:hypothetical protein